MILKIVLNNPSYLGNKKWPIKKDRKENEIIIEFKIKFNDT